MQPTHLTDISHQLKFQMGENGYSYAYYILYLFKLDTLRQFLTKSYRNRTISFEDPEIENEDRIARV